MTRPTISQTFSRIFTVLLFSLAVLSVPQSAFAKQKLGLGFTGKSRAEVDKSFAGIIAHLNKSPDFDFEIFAFPTYEA